MKNKLIIISLLLSFVCQSQITSTKTSQLKEVRPVKYDSLYNFLGDKAFLYKGQTLYLKGKIKSLRKSGYPNFYNSMNYKYSLEKKNIYNCCSEFYSKYDGLANRYFKVLDVKLHPRAKENEILYSTKRFLKLQDIKNNNIFYYEYDIEYEHNFPFVVVGYYKKLNKTYKSKKYVLTKSCTKQTKDINTGKPVIFDINDTWNCDEVTIDESKNILAFKLSNQRGNTVLVPKDRCIGKWNLGNVYSLVEVKMYINQFGVTNWENILKGVIKIGFTEEMVALTWGKPNKINKSSYGSQWIYNEQYLYFKNGVLTSFN